MMLSVIIVNYNVKYFLEQCLHSVSAAIRNIAAEILVVDNNSTDGSVQYLEKIFPTVKFIGSKVNLGFGKANNLGVSKSTGEHVLFLNPDTIVPEDCFEKCIEFIAEHPHAGALGIQMLDGSGQFLPESKRSFPTTAAAFYKLAGLASFFPASPVFNKYSLGYLDKDASHPVEVLAGAFMLVRRAVLEQVGGFDEQFFMYGEDIDLSYRIRKAGFENWYFAGSQIIHFKGESTRKESGKYVRMFYRAMIVFVNKHYKGQKAILTRLVLKTGITIRGLISWLSKPAAQQKRNNGGKVLIIGRDEDLDNLHHIIPQRHNTDFLDGIALSIEEVAQQKKVDEIVFCSSRISYKEMIGFMRSHTTKYHYRFHATGSNSIVGSDSKTTTGIVYYSSHSTADHPDS